MVAGEVDELRRAALLALRGKRRADRGVAEAMSALLGGDPAADLDWDLRCVRKILDSAAEASDELLRVVASLPGRAALSELVAEIEVDEPT